MFKILEIDQGLMPFDGDIRYRMVRYSEKKRELTRGKGSLSDFANAHLYFGFHRVNGGWVYREWAPGADRLFLTGDMNGWQVGGLELSPLPGGVFEIFLEGEHALFDGCHVKTVVERNGKRFERTPIYIKRVEQDEHGAWCGVITDGPVYSWKNPSCPQKGNPLVYECHVGMAQERAGVGTYREFADLILPRIKKSGYNTVQIMAVMEHPYYGSFGYQVSSFFAPSSRFGTGNDLKYLIDKAHGMNLTVLLDLVHSHAISNTYEGLNEFDGTAYQFFHEGERGNHPAWGTKLFNYGKNEVLHFLLSNLKYWLEEYRFDGFRFDGVTSMIYLNHGLGEAFTSYEKYFSSNTDHEAITYLMLANDLIREINPGAITVAEDMSAMPGMCLPIEWGGIGFDYRLAMGLPDMWIRLTKDVRDEDWNMWTVWHELTSRRPLEKYIGYAESHDQALVGDKTIIFRLCDSEMYTGMSIFSENAVIDRGIALHKLIRLITLTLGGEGYLNFMGNEFGHPEWIDFPREGNGWSYHYARRQWHLADDGTLHYGDLLRFDGAMLKLAKQKNLLGKETKCLFIDDGKKVLVYERGSTVFLINFHPTASYESYVIKPTARGRYKVALSSDESRFGGWDRISTAEVYQTNKEDGTFSIYIPARSAVVLSKTR